MWFHPSDGSVSTRMRKCANRSTLCVRLPVRIGQDVQAIRIDLAEQFATGFFEERGWYMWGVERQGRNPKPRGFSFMGTKEIAIFAILSLASLSASAQGFGVPPFSASTLAPLNLRADAPHWWSYRLPDDIGVLEQNAEVRVLETKKLGTIFGKGDLVSSPGLGESRYWKTFGSRGWNNRMDFRWQIWRTAEAYATCLTVNSVRHGRVPKPAQQGVRSPCGIWVTVRFSCFVYWQFL